MNDWFCKDMGDPAFADDQLYRLRAQFASLYRHASAHEDMAVFIRYEAVERLHCHVMLYFTPDTSELADFYHADPCPQPLGEDLSLFIDNDTVSDSLSTGAP